MARTARSAPPTFFRFVALALPLASLGLGLGARPARAQDSPRCSAPGYRQLDFWIGRWTVTDAQGRVVGHSTVSAILGGCALREEWDSGDVHGTSVNAFDRPVGTWRQMWVDDYGAVLRLEGAWAAGSMSLAGDRTGSDGKTRRLRVTLTPNPDGTLRQLQERSEDGGKSWSPIFDGRYTRTPEPAPSGSQRSPS